MGLFGKIRHVFSKKSNAVEEEYLPDWEETGIRRDDVDMHDARQREQYVKACLEQMAEASRELDTLGGEYSLVTAYLTDIEEIEALPEELQEQIRGYAKKIVEIENTKEHIREKRRIMTEEEYLRMERIEQYMPEGYDRIKEAEDYHLIVKKDLGRLDGERHAYYFRKNELMTAQSNMRGIAVMCVCSMLFLIILLAIIGAGWQLDVQLGYVIAAMIAATTLTLVYVKFHDSRRELLRVDKAINKLVLLQNTVKIRYVNNTNLLEYLYVKYDVNSSAELKKLWSKYVQELEQREQEQQMQQDMEFNQSALVKLLRRCKLQDPNIWLRQAQALLDSKEMVEIRHGLIIRRQKLRKQMEYNAQIAQKAQDEVKDIVDKYPEYAQQILDLVTDYEKALA